MAFSLAVYAARLGVEEEGFTAAGYAGAGNKTGFAGRQLRVDGACRLCR